MSTPSSASTLVSTGSPSAPAGLAPAAVARSASSHVHGRGAATNPASRFEKLQYVADEDALEADRLAHDEGDTSPRVRTLYLRDPSRSAISKNSSPDLGFDASLNPYRGCTHGCAYCYARPTHEYLGFSAGLDFETRVLVKPEMPQLLRKELGRKSWEPQVIAMSGVTDAYQPVERSLEITRGCLRVLLEFRNPVAIITKSALVSRDSDLLSELASFNAAAVSISVTTLDPKLARSLEPRAANPIQRLHTIEALAAAGVPVGVMVAPVIPGLNDHELPRILKAARDAGAQWAETIVLRLPYGMKDLFGDWLERNRPERKERVLSRIRDVRGGKLNDARFGSRMRGEGLYAEQIRMLFDVQRRRVGLDTRMGPLSTEHFRRPADAQLDFFS